MTSGLGTAHMISAITPMKPTPTVQAVHPARVSQPYPGARAPAHAHRSGLAKSKRHHEGERCELKGHRMRGDGRRADPAHEISGERENPHFECHCHADRPSEPHHCERPLPVEPPQPSEEVETAELPIAEQHEDERAAHDGPGQGAAQPPADETQGGEAKMTEDQRPAEQCVDAYAPQAKPQNNGWPFKRGHEVAQQLEQQPRRSAPHVGSEERLTLASQLLCLAECAHDAADMP